MSGGEFAALPPEVNSARMYAGPGTGSMLVAAAAWRGLAGELSAAASAYQQVVSGLTGQSWFGPASQSMAAAAAPYANWLATTAVSAEQAASALLRSVSDFEQAFAATVPPTAIAANRSLLAVLVASNAVGQNAASIAETEADYNQMWLQDAMAMYGYAARSTAVTAVTAVAPFTAPPPVVDPAALPAQGVATGLASSDSTHSQLSEMLGAIPHDLQGLSAAGSAQAAPSDPVSQTASYIETLARSVLPANDTNISVLYGMGQYARNLNTDLDISQATGGRAGFGSGTTISTAIESTSIRAGARPVVAASTGTAGAVGKLAVPSAWTDSVPEVGTTATSAPATPPAAAAALARPGVGVAAAAVGGRAGHRSGRAESHSEWTTAELLGTNEVRHWHAEPGELKGLLGEVATQPGVHEVYFDADQQPGSCEGPGDGG
ncbi:PPE family protein [Mycobacterium sp. SMC-19]|uniref:PPE family protein n=1 Tax=Mycobacterium sp. SMC-19 TaxID=3381630 RepID=UPI00387676B6